VDFAKFRDYLVETEGVESTPKGIGRIDEKTVVAVIATRLKERARLNQHHTSYEVFVLFLSNWKRATILVVTPPSVLPPVSYSPL
jgi:hypothetical protein